MATKPYRAKKDGAWNYDYVNHRQHRKKFYIGTKYDERGAYEVALLIDNLVSVRLQFKEPSRIFGVFSSKSRNQKQEKF